MMRKYYLLSASTVLLLLAVAPVYGAPSLSLGSAASYNVTGRVKVVQSCTSDPISYASQACTGIVPPPGPPILGTPFLNDDFAYANMSQMQAAGWGLNPTVPMSYFKFGNSSVTFLNDGTQAAGASWTKVPANTPNWSVSTRIAWVGNSIGTLQLNLDTTGHYYTWEARGTYDNFGLGRYLPGQPCCQVVANASVYNPQLNVYHILRADMLNNVITAYFDGQVILTYFEPDTTVGATDLTSIGIQGAWYTYDSYDWITAAPLTTVTPTPLPPPTPTTVQLDLSGSLGWSVEGLSTSQANLLVSHSLGLSISPIPSLTITPVTESGSFEQSINLATRIESPGTATSIVKSALSTYLQALPGLGAYTNGYGTTLNTLLAGQSNGPEYTPWWVNGPLTNGSPVQILQGWSSVTGSENLNLGGTLGARPGWIVTSQLTQTIHTDIPNPNLAASPSSSTVAASLNLLWSFDKNADLLLRNNDTLSLTTESVGTTGIPLPPTCPSCGYLTTPVTVTRDTSITASLNSLLASTSLSLNGSTTSQTPNQPTTSSSQAPSLMTLAGLLWVPIGVAAIAAGVIAGVLVLLRRRAMRTTAPLYTPVTGPPQSPAAPS